MSLYLTVRLIWIESGEDIQQVAFPARFTGRRKLHLRYGEKD